MTIRENLAPRRPGTQRLTEDAVRRIRELLDEGVLKHSEIAQQFGVDRSTVSNIKQGRIWGHVQ